MAFLKSEYKVLSIFVVVVFVLLAAFIGINTALAFLTGAVCSILAGFLGMTAATKANVRTSEAARTTGQARALIVSSYNFV